MTDILKRIATMKSDFIGQTNRVPNTLLVGGMEQYHLTTAIIRHAIYSGTIPDSYSVMELRVVLVSAPHFLAVGYVKEGA